jgi:hypothetical protein
VTNRPERKGRVAALVVTVGMAIALAGCGSAGSSAAALDSAAGAAAASAAAAAAEASAAAAAASAAAAAAASAKPSLAPVATAKPTPKPTAAPTPKPPSAATAKPTATPTARPTATPVPDTKTCKTSDGAITNTYPVGWQTVSSDVPEFQCMFFDKGPIVINVDTGYPIAPIHVVPNQELSFDAAVLAATDTKTWKGVSKTPLKVGGLPAVLIVATANGSGSYPRDTERYGYLVDWGANGVIILQTTGPEGDTRLAADKLVLDGMAKAIVIKPNP